jgi:hypothetical protein
MKVLLEGLLPRLVPGLEFICVTHEGKQDLEKSIPKKLRAWKEPGARFVVVRDNDNSDCTVLKARLKQLCADAGRPDTLIRIPCQELEAWYFGEPDALARAYQDPPLADISNKARFRESDVIQQPSNELSKLVPSFQKIAGARLMGGELSVEGNRSRSFQVFLAGVRQLLAS